MLFAVLVVSRILLSSIITLVCHWVLLSVVRLLVRELGALMLAVAAMSSERNAATISVSASLLDDEWCLFAWWWHEIRVAVVLVALLVGVR